MLRSFHGARNSDVDGVMGSTARRGGEGVRYWDGRSPGGGRKDAALIIVTLINNSQPYERRGVGWALRGYALAVGGCKAGMLDHAD